MPEPAEYEPTAKRIRVLTWPAASPAELECLVGTVNVNSFPGGVQIRNSDGEWVTMEGGWAVGVTDDGHRYVLSKAALSLFYRPV